MQHSVQSPLQLLLAQHCLAFLSACLCLLLSYFIRPWFGLYELQLRMYRWWCIFLEGWDLLTLSWIFSGCFSSIGLDDIFYEFLVFWLDPIIPCLLDLHLPFFLKLTMILTLLLLALHPTFIFLGLVIARVPLLHDLFPFMNFLKHCHDLVLLAQWLLLLLIEGTFFELRLLAAHLLLFNRIIITNSSVYTAFHSRNHSWGVLMVVVLSAKAVVNFIPHFYKGWTIDSYIPTGNNSL